MTHVSNSLLSIISMKRILLLLGYVGMILSCNRNAIPIHHNVLLGRFNLQSDLLLLHYDCKTDEDDLHSIAAFGSLIQLPHFADINYYAVAGTYGTQGGQYVPPNALFQAVFKDSWSDAHANRDRALQEVYTKAIDMLQKEEGDIWIAEAGQSDFSGLLIKRLKEHMTNLGTKQRIHIVQHSNWNEESTSQEHLAYVKLHSDYHKIPDGNAADNGTPCYNTKEALDWRTIIRDEELTELWTLATSMADQYNGVDGRYNNPTISAGGMDFSDFSEVQWILDIDNIETCSAFLDFVQHNKQLKYK